MVVSQELAGILEKVNSEGSAASYRAELTAIASEKFNHDLISECILCYEALYSQVSSSTRISDRDRLSALYFREAHICREAGSDDNALAMFEKAFLYKRDLLELNRIYIKRADLDQSKGRPASSDDILTANSGLHAYLYQHFLRSKSLFRPPLYKLLRDSLRLARLNHTVINLEQIYLQHSLSRAKSHLADHKFAEAEYIAISAIDLHPKTPFEELIAEHHAVASESLLSQGSDLLGELHGKIAVNILSQFHREVLPEDAVHMINRDAKSVLLIFVSNLYFPIFRAWFDAYSCFDHGDYLIVALDPLAYRKLQEMGVNSCMLTSYAYQKDFFWGTNFSIDRLKFANAFLQEGIDCLVTGVDSLWIKNPFEILNSTTEDIVAMGLESATKNWKYNINADFLFYRSTSQLKNAFPILIDLSERGIHDQWALNLALSDYGVVWLQDDTGAVHGLCDSLDLKIQLLPVSITSRTLDHISSNSYIFQPSGNLLDKVRQFNTYFESVGIKKMSSSLPSRLLR